VNHLYLTIANLEDLTQIVDVVENEFQILEPTSSAQEIDARARLTGLRRRIGPAADQVCRLSILRHMPSDHQSCRNPGAADLIFLAELSLTSGANNRHASVAGRQMRGESRVSAKTTEVDRVASRCLVDDFGSGGRNQNHGTVRVRLIGYLCGTIIYFESSRNRSSRFTRQQRVV
jgi:hypothetical protein